MMWRARGVWVTRVWLVVGLLAVAVVWWVDGGL